MKPVQDSVLVRARAVRHTNHAQKQGFQKGVKCVQQGANHTGMLCISPCSARQLSNCRLA